MGPEAGFGMVLGLDSEITIGRHGVGAELVFSIVNTVNVGFNSNCT